MSVSINAIHPIHEGSDEVSIEAMFPTIYHAARERSGTSEAFGTDGWVQALMNRLRALTKAQTDRHFEANLAKIATSIELTAEAVGLLAGALADASPQ